MAKPNSSGGDFGAAPGMRVGGARYLLKRLVGRGEFSELWLARDVQNIRDVALKFLPRPFLQDKNLIEVFQQEIRRNGLLKHPHIVATGELVVDYDAAAVVMEFVDGWSLATMKVDKLLHCYSVAEIEPWIKEAGDALAYAHSEFGMVHGDLKPANLLTSTREGIKVSDFGFAALIRSESSKRGIIKSVYSGIGFLSPQQVMGSPPSKLDDVYSLGATIFDLLTGTPPFYKGEIIAQICSLKPPAMTLRLAELGAQCDPVSPVWEDAVAACLAKNPADRPQSVEEVIKLLARKEVLPVSQAAVASNEIDSEDGTTEIDKHPPVLAEKPIQEISPVPSLAPVSPANSTRVAVLFAAVLIAFFMAGLAAAFWFFQHGKSAAPNSTAITAHVAGLVDKSFNTGPGSAGSIRCMVLQPDGKILIGGLFTNFDGVDVKKIARLNSDGSLDTSFNATVPGNVYAIALQSDGQIFIGGQSMHQGRPGRKLVELNPNGDRDEQFREGATFNANIRAIALQPDGRVLVGGDFTTVSRKAHSGLLRLLSDGKIDDSFHFGAEGTSTVTTLAVLPDGKILAMGTFSDPDNSMAAHLIRLNTDGTIDTTFDTRVYAGKNIRALFIEKNDKIIIGGFFNDTNNLPLSYLARLNPDGSPDENFQPMPKPGITFWTVTTQSDGKVIAGGYQVSNNQHHPFLIRFNADGSPDEGFQVPDAQGDSIWSLALQPDGKIIAAGSINDFNGTPCRHIVRLEN